MESKINKIHQFWFQGITDETILQSGEMPAKMWFMKSAGLDREIKERFEEDLIEAGNGKAAPWGQTLKGRMALILLCDQFSRNIYRNTARMFFFDQTSLSLSLQTINEGRDKDLMLIERVFLYLPLEHSENIQMQELSVANFRLLADEAKNVNPANTQYYQYTFSYAQKHYDVVARFGRFPHRNKILGRASTDEEKTFLKQPGSGF